MSDPVTPPPPPAQQPPYPQQPRQPYAQPPYPQQQPYAQPYAAPYVPPRPPAPAITPRDDASGSALGVAALILAVIAAVGASTAGALAAWQIGLGAAREIDSRAAGSDFDWAVLTPVRDWVLLGELSFFAGTAAGIVALVLGIVAIVKDRGRIPAIIGVVVAALGPVFFFVAAQSALSAGLTASSGMGG